MVVIDHHPTSACRGHAVVNPNRLDDLSGLGHLAAVGLVFMTIVAVNRVLRTRGFWSAQRSEPDLLGFLDLVALGTVADVVALKGSIARSSSRASSPCAGARASASPR